MLCCSFIAICSLLSNSTASRSLSPTLSTTVSTTDSSSPSDSFSTSRSPSVSPSPSPPCLLGWSLYRDSSSSSNNKEGHDSCVLAAPASAGSAGTMCGGLGVGAHLLTISAPNATKAGVGLYSFAYLLAQGMCVLALLVLDLSKSRVLMCTSNSGGIVKRVHRCKSSIWHASVFLC